MQTIPAKTIVTRTRSRWWFGTDYNMNLYRGCTHGCIYCDSRSSCYHNPDFDHIAVKENALAIVRDDLRRKVQRGVVATGAMSDPYNPLERKLGLHLPCPGAALGLWIRRGSGYQERPW